MSETTAINHLFDARPPESKIPIWVLNAGVKYEDLTQDEEILLLKSRLFQKECALENAYAAFEMLSNIKRMPKEAQIIIKKWYVNIDED